MYGDLRYGQYMVEQYLEYRSVLLSGQKRPILVKKRPGCSLRQLSPGLDGAAHNFSSFHFQEDPRPVPESSE